MEQKAESSSVIVVEFESIYRENCKMNISFCIYIGVKKVVEALANFNTLDEVKKKN